MCPTHVTMGRVGSYPTFSPLPRRNKLHSFRIATSGNAHVCRCFSFPHQTRLRWALMGPRFGGERRYLSVALVLGFPPAGVTRYSCPVEPGLSSSAAFRHASAAVRPGCGNIVPQHGPIVKCLAKSFGTGYTVIKINYRCGYLL